MLTKNISGGLATPRLHFRGNLHLFTHKYLL